MMEEMFTMQKKLHLFGKIVIELVGRFFQCYASYDLLRIHGRSQNFIYVSSIQIELESPTYIRRSYTQITFCSDSIANFYPYFLNHLLPDKR
jgi:hypothetical protein